MSIHIDFKSFFKKGLKEYDDDFFIRLITGYQGSGKTYLAVKLVHEDDKAITIKTNIKSYKDDKKNIIYFENLEEIFEDVDDNVYYLIDELSKRYTKDSKQDKKFYSWLQQCRKHHRHVYLITQEYLQVPNWLRGIANTIFTTSKVRFLPIYRTDLGSPVLDDDTFEWGLDVFLSIFYKRNLCIAQLYDTFEGINTL